MFVSWSDRYALGIDQIDTQHKELFFIANQIHDVDAEDDRSKKIIALLKRLYAYTRYHFSSEEGLFARHGYPEAMEHRTSHKAFTGRVKEYLAEFRGNPNIPIKEPLDFLVEWIIKHIHGEDVRYRDHFREKGIDPSLHFSATGHSSALVDQEVRELWMEKKLSMEIESIDTQHKELVYILQQFNDLENAMEERKRSFLPSFIQKLFYYAQYHFSMEEELMSKHGYPATLDHRQLHQDFILRIRDFVEEYKLNKESLNREIILFLKDWTINHILKEDAQYKSFVRQDES